MNVDSVLLQAVRGPVMLITFGALVAMDHAFGLSFWRTWPLLFIVYGVLKLLERVVPKPYYAPPEPPPAAGRMP